MIRLRLISIFTILLFSRAVHAKYAFIEKAILPESITASASSEWLGRPAAEACNLSGLSSNWQHGNSPTAEYMWHSTSDGGAATNPHPNTIPGKAWIKFSFDQTYNIGKIWIWNLNQLNLLERGFRNVYIQYSTDGISWTTFMNGPDNYFTLTQANGDETLNYTDEIDFDGIPARYIIITASMQNGNYGSEYYGLSEVRFGIDGTDLLSYCQDGDQNGDCKVNLDDLVIVSQTWLDTANLETFASVAKDWQTNRRAEALTQFIQTHFWDSDLNLYRDVFNAYPFTNYSMMWDNFIQIEALAAANVYEPSIYSSILSDFLNSMHNHHWDQQRVPSGYQPGFYWPGNGDDRYYDDNAYTGIAYILSYDVTGNPTYLQRAKDIFDFVITGWDSGSAGGVSGGGFWHVSRNTNPDKAFKGTCNNSSSAYLCLLLAQRSSEPEKSNYMSWAGQFLNWTRDNLRDTDYRYFDAVDTWESHIHSYKWTYNTGKMIQCFLLRYQLTNSLSDKNQASLSAWASDAFYNSSAPGYDDSPFFSFILAEADIQMYEEFGTQYFLDRAIDTSEYYWTLLTEHDIFDAPYHLQDNLKQFAGMARLFWLLKAYE